MAGVTWHPDTDVAALDLDRANPLTGPIRIGGAQPGDVVAIEILEVTPGRFGLLADDFSDPHGVASRIDAEVTAFGDLARLPSRPFRGTVGLAPG